MSLSSSLLAGCLRWGVVLCSVAWLLVAGGFSKARAATAPQVDAPPLQVSIGPAVRQCPPDIQFGETIQCSLDQAPETDKYTFSGIAGNKILLRLLTGGQIWPALTVTKSNGDEIAGCGGGTSGPLVHIYPCTLPETGDYIVRVYDWDYGRRTGSYTLQMQRLYPAPSNATPVTFGQIVSATLGVQTEVDVYTFAAAAGNKVLLRMLTSGQIWPALQVLDSKGEEVPNCGGGTSGPLVDVQSCILTGEGPYLVIVYDWDYGRRTGGYTLQIQRIFPPPSGSTLIDYGQTLSATLDLPTEVDIYAFSAKPEANVLLRLLSSGTIWPALRVIDANGEDVAQCRGGTSGPLVHIPSCRLPGGLYFILVYDWDYGRRTGGYALHLDCNLADCTGVPIEKSLVLIYAVLDNNLGDDPETWNRLVNNAESGVRPNVYTHLMVDGPGASDAYAYRLQSDTDNGCPNQQDPSCNGRYSGGALRAWSEDTAHPDTLANFAIDALQQYSTTDIAHVTLVLVGHGGGWGANALPGQPSRWGRQEDRLGGILWDDTPGDGGTSRSMSTRALGYALNRIRTETGRMIDLIHLDACSMGMVEVAYEVRSDARYMLASANTDWASFPYDKLLAAVDPNSDIQNIGKNWLALEADALRNGPYPFTLALYDLGALEALANATKPLATQLAAAVPAQMAALDEAFVASAHYESDYNGKLEAVDKYTDLRAFLLQLQPRLAVDPPIGPTIEAVLTALSKVVIAEELKGGQPYPFPGSDWQWPNGKGFSIYLPLTDDEPKRLLYTQTNLAWVRDSNWDEFLSAYWAAKTGSLAAAAAQPGEEMPVCHSTRECKALLSAPLPPQPAVQPPVLSPELYLPTLFR
jgi:hypothetical protein